MANIYIFCGEMYSQLDKDNKQTLTVDVEEFELIFHTIVNRDIVFVLSDMMKKLFPVFNSKITDDFNLIEYYYNYLIDFNISINDICDSFLFEIINLMKFSLDNKKSIIFMGGLY